MESKKRALEIVEIATGKVEVSVDVTGSSENKVERVLRGIFVRDTADAEQGEQS